MSEWQSLFLQPVRPVSQYASLHIDGMPQRLLALAHAVYGGSQGSARHLKEYKERVENEVTRWPEKCNPPEEELIIAIQKHLESNGCVDPLKFTWAPEVSITLDRMLSAFCSFSDTHRGTIAQEYFPVELSLQFLEAVYENAKHQGKALNAADQYVLALRFANGNPLAAAILAHSAFRMAGRDRDTRVHSEFSMDLDSRIVIANSVALFGAQENTVTDPVGDTYHFWAQYSAGMVSYFKGRDNPLQSGLFYLVFKNGSNLMQLVHEKILGKPVIFGFHKEVDRLGIRVGLKMAKWIALNS